MARWYTIDTRHLDHLQTIVDGFVHILPKATMHKHWVQTDCWCDPVVTWNPAIETVIVGHHRKTVPFLESEDE